MLPIQKKIQLITIGISCCIAIGLLVNIFFTLLPITWDFNKDIDKFFYNIFFTPTIDPPQNLIIVDIHDRDADTTRAVYAEVIDSFSKAPVRCIAFDIVFSESRSRDSLGNQQLIESVMANPNILLAINFENASLPSATSRDIAENLTIPESECKDLLIPRVSVSGGMDLPFENLLAATRHIGHINPVNINPKKQDFLHFPIALFYLDHYYPSLPLEIKQINTPDSNYTSILKTIPLNRDGLTKVNFIPKEKFQPKLELWRNIKALVHNNPAKFHAANILVINSLNDPKRPTPIGILPTWTIIASITSQLLQNKNIDESIIFYPVFISSILLFISLSWFLFFTSRLNKRWRKTRFVFIPCNIIFIFVIFLLLRYGQLWLGVFVPLLIFNTSLFIVRAKYYAMIRPPRFVDFVVQVLEAQGEIYPIKVQSEFGEEEENAYFESFLEDKTFQEILEKIKNLTATRAEMRWMGNKLFDAMFHGDIFHLLKNSVEKAQAEHKFLRLRLSIDSPELIRLPWELMHTSKIPPGFLVFNKRISVTRYLSLLQAVKTAEFHIPLKILVIVSNPSDLPPLKIKDEIKVLKKSLRKFRLGGDVRLRFCREATLENIRKELDRKPDVIHFIGHSYFDAEKKESYLCFETESSHTELIDEEMFGNMLHDSSVKLVILNSCESAASSECDTFTGIAQNLVKIGVPAVLAMQIEMPDKSAIWFSSIFYANFLTNYSIEYAVAEARRFIMDRIKLDRPDWAIPVLFMRSCEKFLC